MTQKDKGKSSRPSTEQRGSATKASEKPTKPSPKFPPGIKAIGHGDGTIRTAAEAPKLPREPGHGGGGIRPPKPPDGVE